MYSCSMHRFTFAGRFIFRFSFLGCIDFQSSTADRDLCLASAAPKRQRILPCVTPRPSNASKGERCIYIVKGNVL